LSRERTKDLVTIYRALAKCYRICDRAQQADDAEDLAGKFERELSNP
jgi:hypothetical protein